MIKFSEDEKAILFEYEFSNKKNLIKHLKNAIDNLKNSYINSSDKEEYTNIIKELLNKIENASSKELKDNISLIDLTYPLFKSIEE